ncbi:MAG: ribonuclease H-like domain-containing protein [bacterium]
MNAKNSESRFNNFLKFHQPKHPFSVKNKVKFNHPSWENIQSGLFQFTQIVELNLTNSLQSMLLPSGAKLEDLIFFDTETTGLSGGAGTFVFLLGFAFWSEGNLHVKQLFVSDYPSEPEFINYLSDILLPDKIYVSYNGKCYDCHVLTNRFLLNGKNISFPVQIDLLHHCRRLWKRILGSCSLTDIERHVLNITRTDDIPGYQIPEVYHNYLRTGNVDDLLRVFQHNYQDILSLALIFENISQILSDPLLRTQRTGKVDQLKLGKFFLDINDRRGVDILDCAYRRGDFQAGKMLSLQLKKSGQWDQALKIWNKMYADKSLFAAVELAKYYEHLFRNYTHALEIVNSVLNWKIPLTDDFRSEIIHRKRRLLRKVNKNINFPANDE